MKGVISVVPLTEEANGILEVAGVCGAIRLKRYRDSKEEESESMLLEFVWESREDCDGLC